LFWTFSPTSLDFTPLARVLSVPWSTLDRNGQLKYDSNFN